MQGSSAYPKRADLARSLRNLQKLSPDLELVRTQTIMQGASYCDFRWRMKSKGKQS